MDKKGLLPWATVAIFLVGLAVAAGRQGATVDRHEKAIEALWQRNTEQSRVDQAFREKVISDLAELKTEVRRLTR